MVWMSCKIALVNFWAWATDGACKSPTKSSMYTSRSLTNFSCVVLFIVGNVPGVGMHRFSSGCDASSDFASNSSCAISCAILDAVQKGLVTCTSPFGGWLVQLCKLVHVVWPATCSRNSMHLICV